jgi:sugar fermentation stimulation protein A
MNLTDCAPIDGLRWPELVPGTLLRRYNRFLADITLDSGTRVTAHCPNTGSMKGCCEPGRRVYISRSTNPRRKLRYTWHLIEMPTSLVGIDTSVPNRLIAQAIGQRRIPEFSTFEAIRTEVPVGVGSRIDLRLETPSGDACYVEVKNCTLVEEGVAFFPDAVTVRGLKHLKELEALAGAGHRAAMLYLIQRMDAGHFRPARHIDPAYARRLTDAVRCGVDVYAYDVKIDLSAIRLNNRLEVILG